MREVSSLYINASHLCSRGKICYVSLPFGMRRHIAISYKYHLPVVSDALQIIIHEYKNDATTFPIDSKGLKQELRNCKYQGAGSEG